MSKKVCFFFTALTERGASKVMLTLANSLAELDYQVEVVVYRGVFEGALGYISNRVDLINLNVRMPELAVIFFRKYILESRPDIVISIDNDASCIALLSTSMIYRKKPKVYLSLHNDFHKWFLEPLEASSFSLSKGTRYNIGLFRSKLLPRKRLRKKLFPKADKILTVSKGLARKLEKEFPSCTKRITYIYNPMVSDKLLDKSYEEVSHKWLNSKYQVIICVGSLDANKDQSTLLKAFHIVTTKVEDCKLLVLGEGVERKNLEQQALQLGIADDVDFIGYRKNALAYIRNSDVLVLASKTEALPNVLIEALACNTSIVSTDCNFGPEEILEGGKWGRLVDVGDYQELSDAIISTLLKDNKENLLERAWDFSVDKSVQQYVELINS